MFMDGQADLSNGTRKYAHSASKLGGKVCDIACTSCFSPCIYWLRTMNSAASLEKSKLASKVQQEALWDESGSSDSGTEASTVEDLSLEEVAPLWNIRPDSKEILHVTLPLASAREFFEYFIADNAKMSMLDAVLPPIDEHKPANTDGTCQAWDEQAQRVLHFNSWPKNPWFPLKRELCKIEQVHNYQLEGDCLQYQSRSRTVDTNFPYADSFWMRQVWKVTPVQAPSLPSTPGDAQAAPAPACDVRVTFDVNWRGEEPVLAPMIRSKTLSEHRQGLEWWLKAARASLASSGRAQAMQEVDRAGVSTDQSVVPVRPADKRRFAVAIQAACVAVLICLVWCRFIGATVASNALV